MKKWMEKLVTQLDIDQPETPSASISPMTEERATLVYLIDVYTKNLLDLEQHPTRRVREDFDNLVREIVHPKSISLDKTLFRLRQYFNTYRIDEYTYIQKTFDDFRNIIWDFVDQLAEDISQEEKESSIVGKSLEDLKEAVESNSIDSLKAKSRLFIDTYIEHQTKREQRKTKRLSSVKKNLDLVKKQLTDANLNMRLDHLTKAFNRKSFDEQLAQSLSLFKLHKTPVTLLSLDIDYFKKFNDTYGHAIGDFILIECVKILKNEFNGEGEFVARVGGEEFCVILPDANLEKATARADQCLKRIRSEVWLEGGHELRFTISMGVAQLLEHETADEWLRRADEALYTSKKQGRNRYTVASHIKTAA